jgi:hypothetical protein
MTQLCAFHSPFPVSVSAIAILRQSTKTILTIDLNPEAQTEPEWFNTLNGVRAGREECAAFDKQCLKNATWVGAKSLPQSFEKT